MKKQIELAHNLKKDIGIKLVGLCLLYSFILNVGKV